jgi:GTPase-associated system helical domain
MNNLEDVFGAWLKIVLPDSGIAERDLRLGVIRQFTGTIGKEDILHIVLAFYSAAKEPPTIERLRSAMRGVDTSFGPKDDAELAVIAAGILYEIFQQGGTLAAAAALAILCADFGMLADVDHITELVTMARTVLATEGIRVREENIELPNLGETLRAALESEDEEDAAKEVDSEASLRRVVEALAGYGDKVKQSVASIEARRAEQSDILYWLLSERRNIGGVPLKSLKKEQASLFIAVELANLTRQIPGPASAPAILSTMLDHCKNHTASDVTLEACIQSIGAADGTAHLTKRTVVHPVISPISFAVVKAEETGWEDGWQNAVKIQTKKPANTKYPILKIAEQLYREALLSRALGEN